MNTYLVSIKQHTNLQRNGSISFVMALRQPQIVAQFSTVVWTVYHEVRKFCFWRVLQDLKTMPSKTALCLNFTFRRVVPPNTTDVLQDLDEERSLAAPAEFWNKTMRRHSGTIHHSATARMIRQLLPVDKRYDQLVVVMDGEFTPLNRGGEEIWLSPTKAKQDYVVVSLLPLDPHYGVDQAALPASLRTERQLIVKRRLRAACLSFIGPVLGLIPCKWEDCFMYEAVHSVRQLDRMTKLGNEHAAELQVRPLGELSFSESGDPSRTEEIVYTFPARRKTSA
jgi:hypothetical protein